ncbi:NAD(P)/FAD-dependent oxidoreductase [Nitriliruptor alkaliphilus]|uniref:NAD(P)/FAD-dependent oxidoreductase n=1 Tax=Nitriliruptor alkaliphilus TaxID=427918 RepID=UPI0006986DAC|nr:NAD(P)/FAD-dependent oxidoreductase [Nitriliruptor alkaliphilus]
MPQIAPVAGHTTAFQRTPAWIAPWLDRRFTRLERWLFRRVPLIQRLARALVYWNREAMVVGLAKRRSLLRPVQAVAAAHLRRQVRDPQLRADLTPDFTIGCKRILISNDYNPTLERDDVDLVPSGVREVRGSTIVAADGTERDVDTIVFGTGFEVSQPPIARHVRGRGGRLLVDVWADGMHAHLGRPRVPQPVPARRPQHRARSHLDGLHDGGADALPRGRDHHGAVRRSARRRGARGRHGRLRRRGAPQ